MNDGKIIDLEVILPNGNIEIHPVIIPNSIFFENSFNGYGKIINLEVIFNHLSKPIICPVIVLRKTIDNYILETKKRKLTIETNDNLYSEQLSHACSPALLYENKFTVPYVSPVSISPKIINCQGFEQNMTENIINFIRQYNFGTNLYVKLNDLYPNLEKYIDYYYQKNKLESELKYINDNILPYFVIIIDALNPTINIYIIKYTEKNRSANEDLTMDKLTRTNRLIIFCERAIRWINYCLDNNIKQDNQYAFFSLKKDYWYQYFLIDHKTRDYWRSVDLKLPLDYIYDKLKELKIKIIFNNKTNFYVERFYT